MFTGLVQAVGRVMALTRTAGGARLAVDAGGLDLAGARPGDSISVSGVCLTAVAVDAGGFQADLSAETLARTTLGGLRPGARVNLEPALRLSDRLGGHLVSGHVDGLGRVVSARQADGGRRLRLAAPAALARYIAEKGSITVDGVSLTVNAVAGAEFDLTLIPETVARTTLGGLRAGDRVNLEVDLLARYLERLLRAGGGGGEDAVRVRLDRNGFLPD